jgi:hypothetical protein
MAGQTPESMTTLARLELLDDRLRQVKRIGIGALVIFAIALALLAVGVWRAASAGGTSASEYYVRDANGKPRAWLGMVQDTPALEFRDANGNLVAGFKVAAGDTGLLFLDDQHKVRAKLGLTQGHPNLVLFGDDGKERVVLSDSKGSRGLILMDDNQKVSAGLVVDKNGPELIHANPKIKPKNKAKVPGTK